MNERKRKYIDQCLFSFRNVLAGLKIAQHVHLSKRNINTTLHLHSGTAKFDSQIHLATHVLLQSRSH